VQDYTTTQTRWKAWDYRDTAWSGQDITGFEIEALDGEIGKVDEATWDVGSSYLIVDTGPWIFGRKVMLPAGVVSAVDHDNKRVFVERTKDQIKNAPEFDASRLADMKYREDLDRYYGEGPGWYETDKMPRA
jgi:hypothetical protein